MSCLMFFISTQAGVHMWCFILKMTGHIVLNFLSERSDAKRDNRLVLNTLLDQNDGDPRQSRGRGESRVRRSFSAQNKNRRSAEQNDPSRSSCSPVETSHSSKALSNTSNSSCEELVNRGREAAGLRGPAPFWNQFSDGGEELTNLSAAIVSFHIQSPGCRQYNLCL